MKNQDVEVFALHHGSLLVSDIARALTFYVDVLGMQLDQTRPVMAFAGAWLDLGATQVHLLELPSPDPKEGRPEHGGRDRHLAFRTRNVAGLAERLSAAGVAHTLSQSGRNALFCRDPDGNALEFMEV